MNDRQRELLDMATYETENTMRPWFEYVRDAGLLEVPAVQFQLSLLRIQFKWAKKAVERAGRSDQQLVDDLLKEVSGEADQGDDS